MKKRYIFNPETIVIRISNSVLEELKAAVQNKTDDPERGGILAGRLYPEKNEILITEMIESIDVEKKRTFFTMNVSEVQDVMDRLWEESNGRVTYLGDWHTHPEENPRPSPMDHFTFRTNYFGSKIDQNVLVYIIVGNGLSSEGVWSAICGGVSIKRVDLDEEV